MTTYRLTRESARAARACYTDYEVAALVPPGGLSPTKVADLPIPAIDRFWALNYACGATPEQQRAQACRCARRALERERAAGREPDPRSWTAVETAERYCRGEATPEELRIARSAAACAADSAHASAYAAASAASAASAAYAAACAADSAHASAYAASASAYAAARAASAASAASAAYAAADSEREHQVLEYAAALEAK